MTDLMLETGLTEDVSTSSVPVALHPSFYPTYLKLKRWLDRFFPSPNESIINDLLLIQLLAKKKYLDHRPPTHLFRLVLSIYFMQTKLMNSATFSSHVRHVATRWIPTHLVFPFSSKPVLGCLIGFNVMNRCELFDEENVVVALQKHFPDLQLVKESYYRHISQHENIKIFYFELEKRNGTSFSLSEQKILRNNLEEKIKNSIQQLSPSVFMNLNVEEVYKNLLVLSQEIRSVEDLPQVHITLDQKTWKEVIFNVILVQISPYHRFSLKERLFGCNVLSERMVPIRTLEDRPIDAYMLRLSIPRNLSLLRSDGSLDFYTARQKVAAVLNSAVGKFRDYNGGLLVKQQELLFSFKQDLIKEGNNDTEFLETFFYALVPIEKQALLDPHTLSTLFVYFTEARGQKISDHFSLKVHSFEEKVFFTVHSNDSSIVSLISSMLEDQTIKTKDWAYNFIETTEGFFFNCVLLQQNMSQAKSFIDALQGALDHWRNKKKSQQILRIALENSIVSLDPRIGGGESLSSNVIRILFEGLTRFSQEGHIENGVAESIEVSPDLKEYTFKLRHCLWNNGSLVTAHDFAYAWKKVISPDFVTNFASLFYPIRNAREMKEGKVSADAVGIHAIDDQTLHIELTQPTPYFLQLIAYPIFSPVHRLIDQECPQWPYQAEKNYPCNGPFQLKINHSDQGYQLIKNPLYWDIAHVSLDQIILIKMDPFQAAQAFQNNEIDWLGNPFRSWNTVYSTGEGDQTISCPNGWVGWCVFNTEAFPFNHKKIREAFALAVDRSQLIKGSFLPLTATRSILPSCNQNETCSDFPELNLEKARQLLDEALIELDLTRGDLSINLLFHQHGILEHIARGLKQQFEANLKIECRLYPSSWTPLFQKLTEGKFQMGLIHWTSWVDDPFYTLNTFKFASDGNNFSKWENPNFRKLLDLSEAALNPFQRSFYLHQATKLLSEEVPVLPLFNQPYQALVRKNLVVNTKSFLALFNITKTYYRNGV